MEYLALNVRKVPISQSIKIVPYNNASKNTGDVYLDTACKDSIVQINLDLINFIIHLLDMQKTCSSDFRIIVHRFCYGHV